jgi:hypothetical protein
MHRIRYKLNKSQNIQVVSCEILNDARCPVRIEPVGQIEFLTRSRSAELNGVVSH